ncbi:hypothetical protein [endosymbiont of Ridgeia piscesae]|nr:hypothetical protein [endosymbiont of Ridgeia piscesae]
MGSDGDGVDNRAERLRVSNPRVADNGRLPDHYIYWDGLDNH